jgi:putative component of toxin-antitoxin plasmid stabilization module
MKTPDATVANTPDARALDYRMFRELSSMRIITCAILAVSLTACGGDKKTQNADIRKACFAVAGTRV